MSHPSGRIVGHPLTEQVNRDEARERLIEMLDYALTYQGGLSTLPAHVRMSLDTWAVYLLEYLETFCDNGEDQSFPAISQTSDRKD